MTIFPLKFLLTIAVAAGGGALFWVLGTPLPWLLGSLAATGCLGLISGAHKCPGSAVHAGQITIGLALGLYFTPTMLAILGSMFGWILAAALMTCLMSMMGAFVFQRLTRLDACSSFFASAIGAATDMSIQASKLGGRGDLVALSHSVRVTLVVSVMPVVAAILVGSADGLAPTVEIPGLPLQATALLAAAALLAALIGAKVRLPNAWVMAPLLTSLALAQFIPEHRLRYEWVAVGQVLLGWNLGQRFTRSIFKESPKLIAASALMTVGFGVLGLGIATFVHYGTGVPWVSSMIATAPGGVAEMAITAKVLHLDPPTVTAFHAMRLVFMVVGAGLMLKLCQRWGWLK